MTDEAGGVRASLAEVSITSDALKTHFGVYMVNIRDKTDGVDYVRTIGPFQPTNDDTWPAVNTLFNQAIQGHIYGVRVSFNDNAPEDF